MCKHLISWHCCAAIANQFAKLHCFEWKMGLKEGVTTRTHAQSLLSYVCVTIELLQRGILSLLVNCSNQKLVNRKDFMGIVGLCY